MERYIPISEYVEFHQQDFLTKAFVLDAGQRHQILEVVKLSDGRYELKTMRSPFRRAANENILIVQSQQKKKK